MGMRENEEEKWRVLKKGIKNGKCARAVKRDKKEILLDDERRNLTLDA